MALAILQKIAHDAPKDIDDVKTYLVPRTSNDTIRDFILRPELQYSFYAKPLIEGNLSVYEGSDVIVGFVADTDTTFTISTSLYERRVSLKEGEFQFAFEDGVFPNLASMLTWNIISDVYGDAYVIIANLNTPERKLLCDSGPLSTGKYMFMYGAIYYSSWTKTGTTQDDRLRLASYIMHNNKKTERLRETFRSILPKSALCQYDDTTDRVSTEHIPSWTKYVIDE